MKRFRFAARTLIWLPLLSGCLTMAGWSPVAFADSFAVTNLVTNDQGANSAQITDPHLVNAWGISSSATSPFWVSANGTGLSTLYSVNPLTNATTKVGLEVFIPGDGSVNRVTRAVFDHFTESLGTSPITGPVTNIGPLMDAIRAMLAIEPDDGWRVGEYQGRDLWLIPNEVGGLTLMFPEDY